MPAYTLRCTLRPSGSDPAATRTEETIEARDDAEATDLARAAAEAHGDAFARGELTGAGGATVWTLSRGETVSERPAQL